MRLVVIFLLSMFIAQPALSQDSSDKPVVASDTEKELAPHKFERTEAHRADGAYETEELKALLDPFGPAGLVYLMLIVALMGAVVHVMGQARKVEYQKAVEAYNAAREARVKAAAAAKPKKESALV